MIYSFINQVNYRVSSFLLFSLGLRRTLQGLYPYLALPEASENINIKLVYCIQILYNGHP